MRTPLISPMLRPFVTWILSLFLGTLFLGATHKFYVTTTIVDYKPNLKVLQVTTQLFIDDLELALSSKDPKLRLAPDSDSLIVSNLLSDYFKEHFVFEMEGKILPYTFLGKEYETDIAVSYIEVPLIENGTLTIENRMLLELFDSQRNIIHFKNGADRKSYMLQKGKTMVEIPLGEP